MPRHRPLVTSSPATPSRRSLQLALDGSETPSEMTPGLQTGRRIRTLRPKRFRDYEDSFSEPTPSRQRKTSSKAGRRKERGDNDNGEKSPKSPRKHFRVCNDEEDSVTDLPTGRKHTDRKDDRWEASSHQASPRKNKVTAKERASAQEHAPSHAASIDNVPIEYDPSSSESEDCDTAVSSRGDGKAVSPAKFRPVHFLRCHSLRGNPADVQTELWDCQFRPGRRDVVATAGGRSVCLLDATSGLLLKKFTHPDLKERLGLLTWLRLRTTSAASGGGSITVLAVGGMNHVHLIHPDYLTWYTSFRVGEQRSCDVTALMAHPRRSRWLLVATGDCVVSLWDVGVPAPPFYDVSPVQLMTMPLSEPAQSLAFLPDSELLLAGGGGGLVGWRLTLDTIRDDHVPAEIVFHLPPVAGHGGRGDGSDAEIEVSALTVLGGSHLAVKCTGHGCVYVWPLSSLLPKTAATRSVDLTSAPRTLRWSDTDYLLGMAAGRTLLAAGDNRGDIWLYSWRNQGDSGASSGDDGDDSLRVLKWPRPVDDELSRVGKLPLHRFDIHVHEVCLSEDESRLVAVTHNNMVCIWHRVDADKRPAREETDSDDEMVDG